MEKCLEHHEKTKHVRFVKDIQLGCRGNFAFLLFLPFIYAKLPSRIISCQSKDRVFSQNDFHARDGQKKETLELKTSSGSRQHLKTSSYKPWRCIFFPPETSLSQRLSVFSKQLGISSLSEGKCSDFSCQRGRVSHFECSKSESET